jgi:hypothetical protein
MLLISLCALGNARVLPRALRPWREAPQPSAPQLFAARFEPLGPLLPAQGVTGFIIDAAHTDREVPHPDARLFLAQYALAPRLLECSARHPLVIVDSDQPDALPEIAARGNWTLVAALPSGVKLFRTPSGK